MTILTTNNILVEKYFNKIKYKKYLLSRIKELNLTQLSEIEESINDVKIYLNVDFDIEVLNYYSSEINLIMNHID